MSNSDKGFDFDDFDVPDNSQGPDFIGEVSSDSNQSEKSSFASMNEFDTPSNEDVTERAPKPSVSEHKGTTQADPKKSSNIIKMLFVALACVGLGSAAVFYYIDKLDGNTTFQKPQQAFESGSTVQPPKSQNLQVNGFVETRKPVTGFSNTIAAETIEPNGSLNSQYQAVKTLEKQSPKQTPIIVNKYSDTKSEADNDWVISQLVNSNKSQSSKILELEAKVALLSLDLTRQQQESNSAMHAATEASKVVLQVREGLRSIKGKIKNIDSKIDSNSKTISDLEKRIASSSDSINKSIDKVSKHSSKVITNVSPTVKEQTEPEYKKLQRYDLVMITSRGAFIRDVYSDERKVLEEGIRYPSIGRVTKLDVDGSKVFGIDRFGNEWMISKGNR